MFRKLFLILLIGMGGQLAGMAQPSLFKEGGKIDQIFEKVFNQNGYDQLSNNAKLGRILFGIFNMNRLLLKSSLMKPAGFQDKATRFNAYITDSVLHGTPPNADSLTKTLDSEDLKKHCVFFLQYIGDYNLGQRNELWERNRTSWNRITRNYQMALTRLEPRCFKALLSELENEYQKLNSLSQDALKKDMASVADILGSGILISENMFTLPDGLGSAIAQINSGIANGNLTDAQIKNFIDVNVSLDDYIAQGALPEDKVRYQGYWDQFIRSYLNFARELQNKMKAMPAQVDVPIAPKKEADKQPGQGRAANIPPSENQSSSRIDQIREWAKKNWKPVTVGVTATIAAAGYAVYYWFTGKPATK